MDPIPFPFHIIQHYYREYPIHAPRLVTPVQLQSTKDFLKQLRASKAYAIPNSVSTLKSVSKISTLTPSLLNYTQYSRIHHRIALLTVSTGSAQAQPPALLVPALFRCRLILLPLPQLRRPLLSHGRPLPSHLCAAALDSSTRRKLSTRTAKALKQFNDRTANLLRKLPLVKYSWTRELRFFFNFSNLFNIIAILQELKAFMLFI